MIRRRAWACLLAALGLAAGTLPSQGAERAHGADLDAGLVVREVSYTLEAARDTYLDEAAPFMNHGAESDLKVLTQSGAGRRTLCAFDLSGIPQGGTVLSAVAQFYVSQLDNGRNDIEVRRVTSSWSETDATWANAADDYDPVTVYGSFIADQAGYVFVDVSALAREWVENGLANHGLMLIALPAVRESKFNSRNSADPTRWPKLVLTMEEALEGMRLTAAQSPLDLLPGGEPARVLELEIANASPTTRTLTSLRLRNFSQGPGSQSQMDADWSPLSLYKRLPGGGELLLRADHSFTGGNLSFSGLSLPLAPGESVVLYIKGGASTAARDADELDLGLPGPEFLTFDVPVDYLNSWPIDPAGSFPANGMSAAQAELEALGSGSILAGSERNLVLSVRIPANGYSADVLQKFNLLNLGQASPSDISGMSLWADDGDGQFDPGQDGLLGDLSNTGDRWELTGLDRTIPVEGLRIFVSADIAPLALGGRTLLLRLPADPADAAIGVASGNDGPIDESLNSPDLFVISGVDRVTFSAQSVGSRIARPGEQRILLMSLVGQNSYAQPQTLNGLAVTSIAEGAGTSDQMDDEFSRLSLWLDADNDGELDEAGTDSLLATAFLGGGAAEFGPFAWTLMPGADRHLFVTGDISLADAADGDELAIIVAGAQDFSFEAPVDVVGAWPLDSGGRFTVDGMVAGQIVNHGAPAATLGPGDGPVLAMDLGLPANGYAADELEQLTLVNLGSAGPLEIAELRLWQDGGNGAFDGGGGDDADLGAMTWTEQSWNAPALSIPLTSAGIRLFASVTAAAELSDSASLRLAVPLSGVTVASGNDGPLDFPVQNPGIQILSTEPLLASLSIEPAVSTLGQTVSVSMSLVNRSDESILGIVPSDLIAAGGGRLDPMTGPDPASLDLAPGAGGSFLWQGEAAAPGTLIFSGAAQGTGATSGEPRGSLESTSNVHVIYVQAEELSLQVTQAMPFAVNRGQEGVVPFYLTFSNEGGQEASAARLSALRIRLQDVAGQGIIPASLLSRTTVKVGNQTHLDKVEMEDSGDVVQLDLASHIPIDSYDPVTLSIELGIRADTVVPNFQVRIESAGWLSAEDATSGAPVDVVLGAGDFPVASSFAHVSDPPTRLDVAAVAAPEIRASRGQADVPLVSLELENPGIDEITSDVLVTRIAFILTDASGVAFARPSNWISELRLTTASAELLAFDVEAEADSVLILDLSDPSPTVPVNEKLVLELSCRLAAGAGPGILRARLCDASTFIAHDAVEGNPVPALYASNPLTGPDIRVEEAATSLSAERLAGLPESAMVGEANVLALSLRLRHPGGEGTARIRCDGFTLRCWDAARNPLAPGPYVDRLLALWNGEEAAVLADPSSQAAAMPLTLPGFLMEPGQTATLDLYLDFEASAPLGAMELTVSAADWQAQDANSGDPVLLAPEAGQVLPFSSGLVRMESPARELEVSMYSLMPPVLVGDGAELPFARLTLKNLAVSGAGDILVDHLVIRARSGGDGERSLGEAASKVAAYLDGEIWGQSPELASGDETGRIEGVASLVLSPEAPRELELRAVCLPAAGAVRFGIEGEDIGVVQPDEDLLSITVQPGEGQAFPLWTEAGSFSPANLRESFSNFPNPFAAEREETSFAYYLSRAARVSLRIWSSRGEETRMILDDAMKTAGLHQDDRWDGRNGRGQAVFNGVYLAELNVRYEDGTGERLLRKVAVLR